MADRSNIDEKSAATLTTMLRLRRAIRGNGRTRRLLTDARVRATLAERSSDPERHYRALLEESAAALAEAERVPGAPFTS